MKKTLTSVMAIMIVFSAFAKDEPNIPADNPNPSCDNNTLKTTSGSVSLVANWTPVTYTEPAGKYLLYDSQTDTITQDEICLENNYCPGFTDSEFTGTSMGIYACPDNYPNSATGSTYEYCYRKSTTSCATRNPYIGAHGYAIYKKVTADCDIFINDKSLYNEQNDSDALNDCKLENVSDCEIKTIECDAGYTLTDVAFGDLYGYINEKSMMASHHDNSTKVRCKSIYGGTSDDWFNQGEQAGLNNGDWEVTYNDGTKIKGVSTCNSNGVPEATMVYFNENTALLLGGNSDDIETFRQGMKDAGATDEQLEQFFAVLPRYTSGYMTYDQGSVLMQEVFWSVPGDAYAVGATGRFCWCKLESYTLAGKTETTVTDVPWVYEWRYFDEDGQTAVDRCSQQCAKECTHNFYNWNNSGFGFRRVMFGTAGNFPTCEPNTINLNWNAVGNVGGETGLQFANDGGGMCTYDGIITLPTPPTKTGYTFNGWNVSVVEQSDVPQDPEPQQPKP